MYQVPGIFQKLYEYVYEVRTAAAFRVGIGRTKRQIIVSFCPKKVKPGPGPKIMHQFQNRPLWFSSAATGTVHVRSYFLLRVVEVGKRIKSYQVQSTRDIIRRIPSSSKTYLYYMLVSHLHVVKRTRTSDRTPYSLHIEDACTILCSRQLQ